MWRRHNQWVSNHNSSSLLRKTKLWRHWKMDRHSRQIILHQLNISDFYRVRSGSGWVFIGFYRVRSGSGNNPFEFILGGKTKLGTKILENGPSFRAEHIASTKISILILYFIEDQYWSIWNLQNRILRLKVHKVVVDY